MPLPINRLDCEWFRSGRPDRRRRFAGCATVALASSWAAAKRRGGGSVRLARCAELATGRRVAVVSRAPSRSRQFGIIVVRPAPGVPAQRQRPEAVRGSPAMRFTGATRIAPARRRRAIPVMIGRRPTRAASSSPPALSGCGASAQKESLAVTVHHPECAARLKVIHVIVTLIARNRQAPIRTRFWEGWAARVMLQRSAQAEWLH